MDLGLHPEQALPGRSREIPVSAEHFVKRTPLKAPFPEGLEQAVFGLGCFWGAERRFWQTPGVYTTAVGYAGGVTPNPTYEETCTGRTGHAEVVLVVFDPTEASYQALLKLFWESHDPTQGMRQGNDIGSQYRSAIFTFSNPAEASQEDRLDNNQQLLAERSRQHYQKQLTAQGLGTITTEIAELKKFYYAEDYHQQYLAKNPNGYCALKGTGVVLND